MAYVRYALSAEVFPGGRKVSRVRFEGAGEEEEEEGEEGTAPHIASR